MTMRPPFFLLGVLALAAASAPTVAQTQYRVIVGYPPGGSLNATARMFTDKLAEATGRPFVVENRAGAAGQIGAEALKAAAPDGATLLFAPDSNISVYPHIVRRPVYNPLTDFVAVAHTGDYRIALAVHASVPANDLRGFIQHTKSQPGSTGYGTAGAGTNLHFYGVLLAQTTGANLNHVPYRGTGPALVDLVAGHVPATVLPLGAMLPFVKSGKIRVLGQSGDGRSPSLPDAPTFKELGLPMLAFSGWYGLFAPAGTPGEIVNRYNQILQGVLRTAEGQERMRMFELDIRLMSPTEFQALVKADTERWGPIIRASGFTAASE